MPQPIVIVDYDTQWPLMFARESAGIRAALGESVVAIEHIGSTAVTGLGAKPIIDIMVGLMRMDDADKCVAPLEAIGYTYDPYPEFSERRFFRDGPMGAGPHHLHMTQHGSEFWQENILFRDWLRTHSEDADKYLKLKRTLAAKYGEDRERYERFTAGKDAFISAIIADTRDDAT